MACVPSYKAPGTLNTHTQNLREAVDGLHVERTRDIHDTAVELYTVHILFIDSRAPAQRHYFFVEKEIGARRRVSTAV